MTAVLALDVVVVNYNAGQVLKQCLSGLKSTDQLDVNVTVVDNRSTDDSLAAVASLAHADQINVIRNNTNVGFATACNQGAQQGEASLLAVINPDCFITSDELCALCANLQNNPGADLIGSRVLNEDGTLQAASRRRLPTFWRVVFHLTHLARLPFFKGINIKDDGIFDKPQLVEAVNGACWVIRRDSFVALNGLDEAYPLHFEDLDLFARIKALKRGILYDPKVTPVHLQGYSSQDSAQVKNWKRQGLLRYFRKHRPRWESCLVRFILAAK